MEVRRFAWPLAALLVAASATVVGSTSSGLWDPLELDLLESAGARPNEAPLGQAGVRAFTELFGSVHAAGRIPVAIFGLLTAFATFALARLATDARGASYAVLLLAATPVFVLNSRLMLGDSIVLLAQTLVALGAFIALVRDDRRSIGAGIAVLALGLALSVFGSGLLLGLMPGLLAAAAASWLSPQNTPIGSKARAALTAAAVACGALVAFDIWRDVAAYRATVGGAPRGDEPPAFHHALELAFHGLGPLAALVPLAVSWLFIEGREGTRDLLARFCLLWAAFAYGAAMLFEARYGTTTYAAAPALAVLVALVLRERDERKEGSRLAALIVTLLVGLLVRDALLFPESAFDSLPAPGLAIPEDVELGRLHLFGALVFLAVAIPVLAVNLDRERASLRAPYRALRAYWDRGREPKIHLSLAAISFALMATTGLIHLIAPDSLPMRSVVARGLGVGALVVLGSPIAIAAAQLAIGAAWRLGDARHGSLALAAAASSLVLAFGTLPALSSAFSPREVFEVLTAHRGQGETLYIHDAAERAVDHYAVPPVEKAPSPAHLARALEDEARAWAILPKSKLAEVNRHFRAKKREHLFVVDTENPLAYLVTNLPIEGVPNQNPLLEYVRHEPVALAEPLSIKLKGGYELLGYEIEGSPEALRPGDRFVLRLHWHATAKGARRYEVFVHLDGPGGRVHGDHVPVDGLYPTHLWEPGDHILDEVEMRIPAHYAPGKYTLYTGLYQGSQRAEILEGRKDADGRLIAGEVQVR